MPLPRDSSNAPAQTLQPLRSHLLSLTEVDITSVTFQSDTIAFEMQTAVTGRFSFNTQTPDSYPFHFFEKQFLVYSRPKRITQINFQSNIAPGEVILTELG